MPLSRRGASAAGVWPSNPSCHSTQSRFDLYLYLLLAIFACQRSQILAHQVCVRVVSAQYTLAVSKRPLKEWDCLGRTTRSLISDPEIMPCG